MSSSMASTRVLTLVLVLNLVALALAIAATCISTARRVQPRFLDNDNNIYCAYHSDVASGLGIGAQVLLLATQVLITISSKCLCCGNGLRLRPGCARFSAVILFIIYWITYFLAELFLLSGSRNVEHFKSSETVSCSAVRKAVFGVGAVFLFITAIFQQLYHFCYRKAIVVKPFNQGAVPFSTS